MQPLEMLDTAILEYDPSHVIAMFSGGHDSLVAAHVACQHPRFSFALHLNTGIGIEQTREFVRQTCVDWGVELREYKASEYIGADGELDPQIYEQMVIEYGFPGPAMHNKMYDRLKERGLRHALRDLERDRKDRVLLVTGVRSNESVRRMSHVEPIQVWEGTKVWVAPIWQFSKSDVNRYIAEHDLRRNVVVDLLHMSGECLCGAFAHKGEKEEIRLWFPEVAEHLDGLEAQVKQAGFPWGWEDGPPEWWGRLKAGQLPLNETFFPMLCMTCEANRRP